MSQKIRSHALVMRSVLLASAASLLLTNVAAAQSAHHNFNIPSQDAVTALQAFAKQSGRQVLFPYDAAAGHQTPPINGDLDDVNVLRRLAQAAGLTVVGDDGRTVTLRPVGPTSLQDSGPAPATAVDEVVVTAQKRAQPIQDVPISIVALNGQTLAERHITRLDDLAAVVPGLAIKDNGGFETRIALQGVANTFGSWPLVGLYIDEASVTSLIDMQLDPSTVDLKRVEVLRGPQGTLYGEGSTGGTVRFITNDPDLTAFSASTDVAASETQGGGPSERVDAVLNMPLIADTLGIRMVGTFDHEAGWINQPAADRKDFNSQDLTDLRLKALWLPTSDLTISALVNIHRSNGSQNTGENANGDYIQRLNQTTTPSQDDYDNIYNLTASYNFSGVKLLSTTTYLNQDRVQKNYGYVLPLLGPPSTATPYDVLKPFYSRTSGIFTEEVRLSSNNTGPLQWTIGDLYKNQSFSNYNTFYFGQPGPVGTPLGSLYIVPSKAESDSDSIFGDVSYKVADRLTLGVGARYFEDQQHFTDSSGNVQSGDFHAFDPRFYADYKVNSELNIYGSAANGFRSGGFNNLNQPRYNPESIWTYQLGEKSSLFDRTLTTDVSLFFSDYKNYQVAGLVTPPGGGAFNITSNAGDADISGVNWSLNWRLPQGWSVGLSGDYIYSRFYAIRAQDASYIVGDHLDLIPKYGIDVSIARDFRVGETDYSARLDYSQQGPETYRNRSDGPWYYSSSDTIYMLNGEVDAILSPKMRVGVFAQNLGNDRGYEDPFSIQDDAARPRPRTIGLRIHASY